MRTRTWPRRQRWEFGNFKPSSWRELHDRAHSPVMDRASTNGGRRERKRWQGAPDQELPSRQSASRQAALLAKFFVDDGLEDLERLRADHGSAVDVERRRRVDAQLLALRQRPPRPCGVLAGIEALVELGRVETERRRVIASAPGTSSARWLANITSCISQYLPCSPAQCAASAAFGACAMVGQREVLEDDPDLVAVGLREPASRVGLTRAQNGHW